ncbi:MAG: FeoB-associated Cys-rich membrane protein [Clostridiaceae bacterium]|nr:FeoB-associated Cys-rich membrane protein [Clostridiaceae bacterium]
MIIEIFVTVAIVIIASRILYKSIKKKSVGQCDCGGCSTHCPNYKK